MSSFRTGLLAALASLLLSGGFASAQITADSIASHISADTGRPKIAYATYSENLAVTLGGLSAEALERVLGTNTPVVAPPVSLNNNLGLDPINFANMSSNLTDSAKAELDKVFDYLSKNPDATIMIAGHTAEKFNGNMELSEARANSAKLYLVELGVDAGRIETEGFGNTQPLEGASSKSENMRIEISLTN
ncbi:MAG: OmpA family protein [Akkermansiaceae bacterium]|nr:OmpA family protein [Akkermansiaceae bacterium]MCP5549390.1 OmpA family protein [Akkermansiaceae bacterium]